MKKGGRISLLPVLGVVGILGMGSLLLFGQDSATSAGTKFMESLAKADIKGLVASSTIGQDDAESEKRWNHLVNDLAPYYRFRFAIHDSNATTDSAVLKIEVFQNSQGRVEPKDYQLPLIRLNGKWKVDALHVPAGFFPGLPSMLRI